MKHISLLLLALIISTLSYSQAPQKISYQGIIRNTGNELVRDQQIGMRIFILNGSTNGNTVYTETQTTITNSNGVVSIEIGTGITNNNFSDIDWANGPYFIKTEIDPDGGSNYTISGVSQILSVPYALYANMAETADYNELSNLPALYDGDYNSLKNKPLSISDFELDANTLNITNLAEPIDDQDAVRKAYVDILAGALLDRVKELEELSGTDYSNNIIPGSGLIDIDNNIYKTVIIGEQEWMAENLKVTRYNDGSEIPYVTDNTDWSSHNSGAYTWYDNDYDYYGTVYGALYNYYSVESGNLCPTGWIVPSDADWTFLINYTGWEYSAGSNLKSRTGWYQGEKSTNKYGFSAPPGGSRSNNGSFGKIRSNGAWWSSTEQTAQSSFNRHMEYNTSRVVRGTLNKEFGLSVRCLRDNGGYLPTVTTGQSILNITENTAEVSSNLSNDGGLAVTDRGIVWSRLDNNPTKVNNDGLTSDEVVSGELISDVSGLLPGTTYHVRAYATNSVGTAYGNTRIFTTLGQPAVSDVSAFNITNTSFSLRGNINNYDGQTTISKGFVWSRSPAPTIDNNDGISDHEENTDMFSYDVAGLEPGKTYFIRAYATYNEITEYGNQLSVLTKTATYFSEESANELNEGYYKIAGGGALWDVSWGASLTNWTYGSVASDDAYKGSEVGDQVPINEIERWEVGVSNKYPDDKWKLTIEMGVLKVNELLRILNESNEIFSDVKDRMRAEAHFFRGLFNFEAWLVFKNIPILVEDGSDPGLVSNENPDGAVLEHIITDLQYAWENLPETSSQAKRPTKYAAMALAAKAYMQELKYAEAKPLLDVIINSGRYELMPNFLDNYRISKNNNAESIFEIQRTVNDINESLNAEIGIGMNYPHGADIGTCCGFHQPSQNLVNAYRVDENGLPMFDTFNDTDLKNDQGVPSYDAFTPFEDEVDPRLDWTVSRRGIPYRDWGINRGRDWIRYQQFGGPYLPASKLFFYQSERYTFSTTTGWMTGNNANNFRYLRYGHILLWRAEVAAYEGDLATALDLVNQIRTRAANEVVMGKVLVDQLSPVVYPWGAGTDKDDYQTGGSVDWGQPAANYKINTYTSFTSQAEAMRAVQWELRLEFATEGLRFFDLRRWDNLPASLNSVPMIETLNSYAQRDLNIRNVMNGAQFTERDKYQPIPQRYIDANPLFIQNPGY